jgi:hypothetical protein
MELLAIAPLATLAWMVFAIHNTIQYSMQREIPISPLNANVILSAISQDAEAKSMKRLAPPFNHQHRLVPIILLAKSLRQNARSFVHLLLVHPLVAL